MRELWTAVIIKGIEFPYEVSNLGRVRRTGSGMGSTIGRILKPQTHSAGYLQIMLYTHNKGKGCYIHILVAESFLGPIPEGQEVNHKDGNKHNNRLDNLEFMTRRSNIQHSCQHKLSPRIKLTPDDVREIRLLVSQGMKQADIARKFNVLPQTIYSIKKCQQWQHVK